MPTWTRKLDLDLTAIDPTEWRRSFNSVFAELGPGESFVLVSNHRPGAILAGCRSECGPRVCWNALLEGPPRWRFEVFKWPEPGPRSVREFLAADHGRLIGLCEQLESAPDRESARPLAVELETGLLRHFRMKEHVLFPSCSHRPGPLADAIESWREEHVRIRAVLGEIKSQVEQGTPASAEAARLKKALIPHHHAEEQSLYPSVDAQLSERGASGAHPLDAIDMTLPPRPLNPEGFSDSDEPRYLHLLTRKELQDLHPVLEILRNSRDSVLASWYRKYLEHFGAARTLIEADFLELYGRDLDAVINNLLADDLAGFEADVRSTAIEMESRGVPFVEVVASLHLFEESSTEHFRTSLRVMVKGPKIHLTFDKLSHCRMILLASTYFEGHQARFASRMMGLEKEAERLSGGPGGRTSFHGLIGASPPMRRMYEQIAAAAGGYGAVLVFGPSGHRQGARRSGAARVPRPLGSSLHRGQLAPPSPPSSSRASSSDMPRGPTPAPSATLRG